MSLGFRVLNRSRAVSADTVARFRELPVANVSDSMNRMTATGPTLAKMHGIGSLAGPALTVKTRPGDNLMLHKAIDMAVPGDVIVVDGGGELTNSLMGEMMLAYAIKRGVAGFVINGAIRDADAFRQLNLPTWAAGITHRGPYKDGPGEINVSIAIGGMIIEPGDLILGDSDGVVCVPLDAADEIYAKTLDKRRAEQRQMEAIEKGSNDRTWVDAALRKLGCELPQ